MSSPAARAAGTAALALYAAHCWLLRGFYVDDAYISLRYLRQWGAGNGLVFNPGERVEGFSNPLWLAVLAPFERFGADPVLASKGVGFLCGLLAINIAGLLRTPSEPTISAGVLMPRSS